MPPVEVDEPEKGGAPSDHSGVVASPLSNQVQLENRTMIIRTIRPITESNIKSIGQVITKEE